MGIRDSVIDVHKSGKGWKWTTYFLDHEMYDEGTAPLEDEARRFAGHHTVDVAEMDYLENTIKMLDYVIKKYEDEGNIDDVMTYHNVLSMLMRLKDKFSIEEIASKGK